MNHEASYQSRWCSDCTRNTRHRIVHGRTGQLAYCWECPAEDLTAWLIRDGLIASVVITDEDASPLAARPIPYAHHQLHQADRALSALGFTRLTGWTSTNRATTCTVRRR